MLDDDSLDLLEDDIDDAAYDAHAEARGGDASGAKDAAGLDSAETDEEFDDRIKDRLARFWERGVGPFFAPLCFGVLQPIVWHARRGARSGQPAGATSSNLQYA